MNLREQLEARLAPGPHPPPRPRGRPAHAYLLEGESGFAIIEAADWRTKAAKEARDAARAAGKIPLLADRWGDVHGMALAAQRQLDAPDDTPRPLAGGKPEQTLIWQEDGLWCRARLGRRHDGLRGIAGYKTTAGAGRGGG